MGAVDMIGCRDPTARTALCMAGLQSGVGTQIRWLMRIWWVVEHGRGSCRVAEYFAWLPRCTEWQ